MEKQPFDEDGLQVVLSTLYSLPDDDLREEAYALRNHPKLWIYGHFDLDEQQLAFLENLSATVNTFLGQQGGFAIEHRLPITLSKTEVPKTTRQDGKEDDKWFKPISNLAIDTNGQGQCIASGSLDLKITYLI